MTFLLFKNPLHFMFIDDAIGIDFFVDFQMKGCKAELYSTANILSVKITGFVCRSAFQLFKIRRMKVNR